MGSLQLTAAWQGRGRSCARPTTGTLRAKQAATAAASESDPGPICSTGGFAVDTNLDLPRVTLIPQGELDLASAPALHREIEALPWPQLAEVVFDLAGLTFIDSTGLSVLIRASQRAATAGLRFSVVRAPEQPRALFTLAGVTETLNLQP